MECQNIINTFAPCLIQAGWDPDLAQFASIFMGVLLVATFPLLTTVALIWVERKIAARIQDRLGPNRVGPFGLLQPIADVVKLIGKEDITPAGADRWIYNASPVIMVMSVLLIWAVIPFTPIHVGVDLEIGVLYFIAVASIGTLAVIMAGWSSNNKYALLGAFRVVAQLISYEIPLALSVVVTVLLAGTMSMVGIVEAQAGMWFLFMAPVSAVLFFISAQAETGRAPFDLIEAESELVAGYNIEYSGMKFAIFFAGEFMHVFTNGMLMAVLFTGGYHGPFVQQIPLLGMVWLIMKASVWYFISLWVRNSLPRLRIDQLMSFNWTVLVPLSIVNLLVMAFLLKVVQELGIAPSAADANSFVANVPQTLVFFLGNVAVFAGLMAIVRNQGRRERLDEETEDDEDAPLLPAETVAHASE
jgi:NADH-quinone oxidoreductase subunit H